MISLFILYHIFKFKSTKTSETPRFTNKNGHSSKIDQTEIMWYIILKVALCH